jgi:hypothetical protein
MYDRMLRVSLISDPAVEKLEFKPNYVMMMLANVCDDMGRARGTGEALKNYNHPIFRHLSVAEMEAALTNLEEAGLIQRYECNGEKYLQYLNWQRFQKLHRARQTLVPPPKDPPKEPPAPVNDPAPAHAYIYNNNIYNSKEEVEVEVEVKAEAEGEEKRKEEKRRFPLF